MGWSHRGNPRGVPSLRVLEGSQGGFLQQVEPSESQPGSAGRTFNGFCKCQEGQETGTFQVD